MNKPSIVPALVAALLATSSHMAFAASSPQDFIKDAIQGDNSEIMLGQLAQQKGGSDKVKNLGATLVQDHTKAKQEASDVAKTLGVTPPTDPMQDASDESNKLNKMSGGDFDHEFGNYMVKDHIKDIAEFQEEAKADQGPAGTLAGKQIPDLQKHLQMAQSIATPTSGSNGAPPVSGFLAEEGQDNWRGSKLMGVNVYGPDNKKVGSISDVLMDHEGKATYLVVGVGGFLGLGQKDVAIPFDQVKFTDEPLATARGATADMPNGTAPNGAMANGAMAHGTMANGTMANGAAMAPGATAGGGIGSGAQPGLGGPVGTTTGPGAPGATGMAAAPADNAAAGARSTAYPNHGVISLTADQLKAAPTFRFAQ